MPDTFHMSQFGDFPLTDGEIDSLRRLAREAILSQLRAAVRHIERGDYDDAEMMARTAVDAIGRNTPPMETI